MTTEIEKLKAQIFSEISCDADSSDPWDQGRLGGIEDTIDHLIATGRLAAKPDAGA